MPNTFTGNLVEVPTATAQDWQIMIWADYLALALFVLCTDGFLLSREPIVTLEQIFGYGFFLPAAIAIVVWWGLRFLDWLLGGPRRRSARS
jgi:hypothetical protein